MPTETEGRDKRGRFAKGYAGGPGNPHAAAVCKLRAELFRRIKSADLSKVVNTLVTAATSGDVAAAKLVLAYGVAPPEILHRNMETEAVEQLLREALAGELMGSDQGAAVPPVAP